MWPSYWRALWHVSLFKNALIKNNRKERQGLIQFWLLRIIFHLKVSESTGTFFGQIHYLKEHFCSFRSLYYKNQGRCMRSCVTLQKEMKLGADVIPVWFGWWMYSHLYAVEYQSIDFVKHRGLSTGE